MPDIGAYIQGKAEKGKIVILYDGILSIRKLYRAVHYLKMLGVRKYFFAKSVVSFIDNKEKTFLILAVKRPQEIVEELDKMGLSDLEDYINPSELEYYDALIRYQNAPKVPEITEDILYDIETNLRERVLCEDIKYFDKFEFENFKKNLNFGKEYYEDKNGRYNRKIMEFYFVCKFLEFDQWNAEDIYIDVGAAGSPFVQYLRKRKINAYALDLKSGRYGRLPYYLVEDATNTHFADNSVQGISAQSAFEMFIGNADTKFVKEAARILKPGGKLVIAPLYMHEQYLSTVSPNYYHKGFADEGSFECIRTDCRGGCPMGRFYSVDKLNERVIAVARESGLDTKVYILPNEIVEKDDFVYLKFILEMSKR